LFAACAGRANGVKIAGFRKSGHGVCGESLAFPQFGERIAQLLIQPVARPALNLVDEFPDSTRGSGGFGHTGSH